MSSEADIPTNILAETQNYIIWTADEPDGETTYNVELNNVPKSMRRGFMCSAFQRSGGRSRRPYHSIVRSPNLPTDLSTLASFSAANFATQRCELSQSASLCARPLSNTIQYPRHNAASKRPRPAPNARLRRAVCGAPSVPRRAPLVRPPTAAPSPLAFAHPYPARVAACYSRERPAPPSCRA